MPPRPTSLPLLLLLRCGLAPLLAALLLALVITVGRLVVLVDENAEADLLREQQTALNEMAHTATRLLVVTQDYLLHAEPRAVVQWNLLHAELIASMARYAGSSDEARRATAPIELEASAMPLLFERLVALRETAPGRHVYAVGNSPEATRLTGIATDKVLLGVYVLAGLFYGIASLLSVARTGAGDPNAGQTENLDAISAVVLGGTSLFGGRGVILGTLVGR